MRGAIGSFVKAKSCQSPKIIIGTKKTEASNDGHYANPRGNGEAGALLFAAAAVLGGVAEVASIAASPVERHRGSRPFARAVVPAAAYRNGRVQESNGRHAPERAAIRGERIRSACCRAQYKDDRLCLIQRAINFGCPIATRCEMIRVQPGRDPLPVEVEGERLCEVNVFLE